MVLAAAVALFMARPTVPVSSVGPDGVAPSDLVARGDTAQGASFSAYVVTPDGGFSRLEDGATVPADHRLKLRLSWTETASRLDAVWVALVPSEGQPRLTRLAAPEGRMAAVPGVVSLWGMKPGPVDVYVVASAVALSESELQAATASRPTDEELMRSIQAAGVTRLRVRIEASEAPVP